MESLPEGSKKRRALSVPTVLFKSNKTSNGKKSGYNPGLSTKQSLQLRANMIPYRENGVLKYMPTAASQFPRHHDQASLASGSSNEMSSAAQGGSMFDVDAYDSDCEPLMGERDADGTHLDEDALMRFTATGRPMPNYKPSALANMGASMFLAPQHLPQRYTDESIIPVIVRLNQLTTVRSASPTTSRRKSFLGKLKGSEKTDSVKVVYMPRGEYLKFFARDQNANYVGTEPEQEWTEIELEDKYGKYKKW